VTLSSHCPSWVRGTAGTSAPVDNCTPLGLQGLRRCYQQSRRAQMAGSAQALRQVRTHPTTRVVLCRRRLPCWSWRQSRLVQTLRQFRRCLLEHPEPTRARSQIPNRQFRRHPPRRLRPPAVVQVPRCWLPWTVRRRAFAPQRCRRRRCCCPPWTVRHSRKRSRATQRTETPRTGGI
jgi:hypothetical protein